MKLLYWTKIEVGGTEYRQRGAFREEGWWWEEGRVIVVFGIEVGDVSRKDWVDIMNRRRTEKRVPINSVVCS